MAKEEKKNDVKNEKVHLDMSFDDALRLAANTPPLMHKMLNLNEKTELPRVAGKSFELISLKIKSKTEQAGQFRIVVDLIPNSTTKAAEYFPFTPLKSKSVSFGVFNSLINVSPDQKVFVTLITQPGYKTEAKLGTITFSPQKLH